MALTALGCGGCAWHVSIGIKAWRLAEMSNFVQRFLGVL